MSAAVSMSVFCSNVKHLVTKFLVPTLIYLNSHKKRTANQPVAPPALRRKQAPLLLSKSAETGRMFACLARVHRVAIRLCNEGGLSWVTAESCLNELALNVPLRAGVSCSSERWESIKLL